MFAWLWPERHGTQRRLNRNHYSSKDIGEGNVFGLFSALLELCRCWHTGLSLSIKFECCVTEEELEFKNKAFFSFGKVSTNFLSRFYKMWMVILSMHQKVKLWLCPHEYGCQYTKWWNICLQTWRWLLSGPVGFYKDTVTLQFIVILCIITFFLRERKFDNFDLRRVNGPVLI